MHNRWCLLIALLLAALSTSSQNKDLDLLKSDHVFAELDSLLNSTDSLSILDLIDSLLSMPPERSQMAVRLGYNSNVSASRTLGVNQFGLSPGISYFHKSGFYGDASAYWSKEYEPALYLSVMSVGYMNSLTKYWSLLSEYSHYFYLQGEGAAIDSSPTSVSTPYTNNLQLTNFVDAGAFALRLDYSFLFGELTAHRLAPSVGLNITKSKWLGVDRVSFFPSVNLLYGSETDYDYVLIPRNRLELIYRYRNNLPLFEEKKRTIWGIMNYAFSVPVSLSYQHWALLINYTYNIARAIPGEDSTVKNSGFISFNITRYVDF